MSYEITIDKSITLAEFYNNGFSRPQQTSQARGTVQGTNTTTPTSGSSGTQTNNGSSVVTPQQASGGSTSGSVQLPIVLKEYSESSQFITSVQYISSNSNMIGGSGSDLNIILSISGNVPKYAECEELPSPSPLDQFNRIRQLGSLIMDENNGEMAVGSFGGFNS